MTHTTPVRSTLPVAPWVGSKRLLSRRIVPIIDTVPHTTYAEPFIGMGGIFLRRTRRPTAEVINDADRDVANLFRILQRHYPQFMEVIRFQLSSRAEFDRLATSDPDTLTDLERAHRILYLQRTAFGGKLRSRTFGVAPERPARFSSRRLEPMLRDLHARMSGVVIVCLDFAEFIARYDRPGPLFYCDPPYWGSGGCYGKELFCRADFQRLADALSTIRGRFILSLTDRPEVRELFGRFAMIDVQVRYSSGINHNGREPERELLISNFTLPSDDAAPNG